MECRYDWHQTATHVTVAIYAKKYDPDMSKIEIHHIRLKVHVYFPEQAGSFDLDIELAGVCVNIDLLYSVLVQKFKIVGASILILHASILQKPNYFFTAR